jgi:hypothetical protein
MDTIRSYTPDEWRKQITNSYTKHGLCSKDDAKIKFLELIYNWQTFGSAFFEVKVSWLLHRLTQIVITRQREGMERLMKIKGKMDTFFHQVLYHSLAR